MQCVCDCELWSFCLYDGRVEDSLIQHYFSEIDGGPCTSDKDGAVMSIKYVDAKEQNEEEKDPIEET